MKRFEHIINSKFQEFFKGWENPENHLYFESFEWWKGNIYSVIENKNTNYYNNVKKELNKL